MKEEKKGRMALFIENMLAYGATTALAKVVPLVMLPIITKMLTNTADYGRYDMYNTIVEFGSNIAILGLYDAMFREYFERANDLYKKKVTNTAFNIVCISSVAVFIILCVFRTLFSQIFFGNAKNVDIILLSAISVTIMGIKTIVAAPIRMENRRKLYINISLTGTIVFYLVTLIFVMLGYNYAGMIYANIIYAFGLLVVQWIFTHNHFSFFKINKRIAKELFKIGIPLLPTFVIYWIFHGMDKIMITNMLDLKALGVYSVGAKLAQVSQIVYTAFSVGWQYFAFSTMKDKDQVKLNSKVMEYLGIISCLLFILSTFFDDFVFNLLFSGDYVNGVTVFPYLFLSPLILMIYQVIGNQTIVYKKSYLNTFSLLVGTVVNLLLNYILIKELGIKGAAIATLCSYLVSYICMIIINLKYRWMLLSKKYVMAFFVMLIYILLITIYESFWVTIIGIICFIIIIILYIKDLKKILYRIL